MSEDEALAYYERTLKHRESQRRYVAEGQRELAGRMAHLMIDDAEIAWAKGCLDSSRGIDVDWAPLRNRLSDARSSAEEIRDLADRWRRR